jgi:N-acetylneuraminate synthase
MKNTFIIGEIGINHNGDISIAKQLISSAAAAGANAVKFQKRTINVVYTKEELNKPRESPWGTINREQKEGLEFNKEQYDEINDYCKQENIEWFASCWDVGSQEFIREYNLNYNKVASAVLTNRSLVEEIASEKKHTFISTGMSTIDQIDKCVEIFKENDCPYELMHCNSEYPLVYDRANLKTINTLRDRFKCDIGYSGHETDTSVSIAAVALGATSLERHITIDRCMYGSDQASSIEIEKFRQLINEVRKIEKALGDGVKVVTDKENEIAKKLRTVDTL